MLKVDDDGCDWLTTKTLIDLVQDWDIREDKAFLALVCGSEGISLRFTRLLNPSDGNDVVSHIWVSRSLLPRRTDIARYTWKPSTYLPAGKTTKLS